MITISTLIVNETLKTTSASRDRILPFKEHPGTETSQKANVSKDKLNAAELFSLFTADIIKEKVVFIR